MKRTIGTARMVVTGMILMGGALGTFGDMKLPATNPTFPRVPRTEQGQTAQGENEDATPAKTHDLALAARRRSGETDPCVPVVPVTFAGQAPVMC